MRGAGVILKFVGFAAIVGAPTAWLYYFWVRNTSLQAERVELPWPSPDAVYASLPEAMLVAAIAGLLLGLMAVFVLFGATRGASIRKLRRQADRLRQQLEESRAENEVLRRRVDAQEGLPSAERPMAPGIGQEKPPLDLPTAGAVDQRL